RPLQMRPSPSSVFPRWRSTVLSGPPISLFALRAQPPPRFAGPSVRHRARGDTPGSFGQPRFPKTLNQQLRVCLHAPSDQRRYCKRGIDLKQMRRRLSRLSVTSEMGESGHETAITWRKRGVLALGFLPCDDGLVKATELDKGQPHPSKRLVQLRVDWAYAHGPFKAPHRFPRQPRNSIDPASAVPCDI